MPIHPQNWNFPNDFRTEVCVGHIASTTWEKKMQRGQKFFTVVLIVSVLPSHSPTLTPLSARHGEKKDQKERREVIVAS